MGMFSIRPFCVLYGIPCRRIGVTVVSTCAIAIVFVSCCLLMAQTAEIDRQATTRPPSDLNWPQDPKSIGNPSDRKLLAVRQQTIAFLSRLSNDDKSVVVAGQNLGHSNSDPVDGLVSQVERLARHTGHFPALLGVDYGYDEFPQDFARTNYLLLQHFQKRGLVTISMHPPNPWHVSDCHDLRIEDLRKLTDPSTRVGKQWLQTLDHIAGGLSELDQMGVVVLWRPLHEANGGWFWWGANREGTWVKKDAFVALWRHMHNYFSHHHHLDNLAWVYSAAVQKGDGEKPADYFYPGDAYVDIVGLDWYDDDFTELDRFGSYRQLVALGKPVGLTEVGPLEARDGSFSNMRVMRAIATKYPKIGFFMFWHSWPGAKVALIDNADSRALMRDPRVITRRP